MADGASTAQVSPHWQAPDLSDLHASDQHRGLRAYGHRPRARLLGAELAELERSQQLTRLPIAIEYIRRSGLNVITGPRDARIGLVAAGKTYLDLRQALTALGLTEAELERHGIRLLKLGVIYPLEPGIVAEFASGLDEILVVEDKRAFLEDAVKSVLYGQAGAPAVYGKRSRDGSPLFAAVRRARRGLGRRRAGPSLRARRASPSAQRPPRERVMLPLAQRMPYFCSGCPHNSSTKVAPGTLVGGGIGCHAMVAFMPEEQVGEVIGLCQMGGEGGAVDGHRAVRDAAAPRAEHRRRHLRPLRQPRHPGRGGLGREHHLQAAAQLGRRDDRRPAGGRRAAGRPAPRPARRRGRAQDRRHHRRPGQAPAAAGTTAPTSGTATT